MEKEYDIVAMGELLIDFTPAGVSETGMCLYLVAETLADSL